MMNDTKVIDQWADSMLEEATDWMMARQLTVSPASLALNEQEAKAWLEGRDWYVRLKALRSCLETFMESSEFPDALAKGTRDSWGGGGTNVEIYPNGTWRVLFNMEIGNLYESPPGEILSLPTLDDDDYQECVVENEMDESDYFLSVYQNDEQKLKQELRDRLAGVA